MCSPIREKTIDIMVVPNPMFCIFIYVLDARKMCVVLLWNSTCSVWWNVGKSLVVTWHHFDINNWFAERFKNNILVLNWKQELCIYNQLAWFVTVWPYLNWIVFLVETHTLCVNESCPMKLHRRGFEL